MKKLRIRQLEDLKVCPFGDKGICIDRVLQKNCELLPICLEVAKIKVLKEISETLKNIEKGDYNRIKTKKSKRKGSKKD